MKILKSPNFSQSPPPIQTLGQPILGRHTKISQYVPLGKQSSHVKKILELPEAQPLKVIEGYAEMMENRGSLKSDEADLGVAMKSAAQEYFDTPKPTKDDSYNAASSVTEKNQASKAFLDKLKGTGTLWRFNTIYIKNRTKNQTICHWVIFFRKAYMYIS